jgi:hypothetical protein
LRPTDPDITFCRPVFSLRGEGVPEGCGTTADEGAGAPVVFCSLTRRFLS